MIPDNIEKIVMTKDDYDRNVEKMLLEKLELEENIEKAISLIETHTNDFGDLILEKKLKNKLLDILRGEVNEYSK